ncbi:MAG: lytic transglycosylase domain-containing protein [Gammaproteobacteria bacterium]|nr:lytic transglycosylase domain-containing protein [Gammaproteobacteria bacterium]
MRKHLFCFLILLITNTPFAEENTTHSPQNYLKKYRDYVYWTEHFPSDPNTEFLEFIEPITPLSQKLHEKWLHHLAKQKDWIHFNQSYRPSPDVALRCHAQRALYHLADQQINIDETLSLWLSAKSQPPSCTALFDLLLKDHTLTQQHIDQRIALALSHNRSSLASYLLRKSGPARATQAKSLSRIMQSPKRVLQLRAEPLSSDLCLYGLKRMVSRNMKGAISLWRQPQVQTLLSQDQKQKFLAHLALYQAMRNQDTAEVWFAKVQPTYRSRALHDWEIRYALLHHNWKNVITLTANEAPSEQNEKWQYWRARALGQLGKQAEAKKLYSELAVKRSYYGFLASIQLQQPMQFESEATNDDLDTLEIYKPITEDIAKLYHDNKDQQASRAIDDFSSELPKSEKSALTYWVAEHLHWPGKAVYLSTKDDALNDQLALRFPLTHQTIIQTYAKQYHLSEALIYAMIRQESMFFNEIVSPAGAYGLMQVMPSTAKHVARVAHIPYRDAKELFSAEKNIQIGTAYLQILSQKFQGHPILMAAAYNAGPRQARYWYQRHPPKEMDIWIETLPWQETRNYLKNVIAFYAVYQYRMNQTPDLQDFLKPL